MTDFFAELEDDIREERVFLLWRKYGNWVIGAAIAVVLATAAYTLWHYLKTQKQLGKSTSFIHAIELKADNDQEKALQAFQLLSQDKGGYGKLAQLYQAALLSDAKALYSQIAQGNARDASFGNLSKVLLATRNLDDAEALSALEALTAPQNAWAPLSREVLALAHLKKGEIAEATKQFRAIIADTQATPSERLRSQMMLVTLDAKAPSTTASPSDRKAL